MVEPVRLPEAKGDNCEGLQSQRRPLSLPEPLRLVDPSAEWQPKAQRDGGRAPQCPRPPEIGPGACESGPAPEPGPASEPRPVLEPGSAERESGFVSEPVPEPGPVSEPGYSTEKVLALSTQDELYCPLCSVLCNGDEQWTDHLAGHKHRRRVHGIRARWQTWPIATLAD